MFITSIVLIISLITIVLLAVGFARDGKFAEAWACSGLSAALVHMGFALAQASYGASPAGDTMRDIFAWLALAEFAIAGILAIARIMHDT